MEFPLHIIPTKEDVDVHKFVIQHKESIKQNINKHGAVLFRGWDIDVKQFAKIANELGPVLHDISCSAGPRIEVISGVHTANEAPPSESIPFHHEMAQCPVAPKYVLFYCEIPPASDGETPIIHSWKLAKELQNSHPHVAVKLRQYQIRYVREFPSITDSTSPLGKSWKATLCVKDKDEAEKELLKQGCEWKWLPQNRLRTIGPCVPIFVKRHEKDTLFTAAESVFLEQSMPGRPEKSFIYGNGDILDEEEKNAFVELSKFAFKNSVHVAWKKFDVLIIDNATVMHARNSFTLPRRILTSLVGTL